jgi:hypothetical protein
LRQCSSDDALIDIGGGHVSDFEGYSLSYIPLRWMIKEAIKAKVQILFDPEKLNQYFISAPTYEDNDIDDFGEPVSPFGHDNDAIYYTGTEGNTSFAAELRRDDVKAPIHDSLLKFPPYWWVVEFIPIFERKQAQNDEWILTPQCVPIHSWPLANARVGRS